MRCYVSLLNAATTSCVWRAASSTPALPISTISTISPFHCYCCSTAIPTSSPLFTGGLFSYTRAHLARVRGKSLPLAGPVPECGNETLNENKYSDMDSKETPSQLSFIRRHLGAIQMQESLEGSSYVDDTPNVYPATASLPTPKGVTAPGHNSNDNATSSPGASTASKAIDGSAFTDPIYGHSSQFKKKTMTWCIPDHLDRMKCSIADIYRRGKINRGFEEVFRGTSNETGKSFSMQKPNKERYMQLLPFLNPVRDTPLGMSINDRKKGYDRGGSNKGNNDKRTYDPTSSILRGAMMTDLARKIRVLWERERSQQQYNDVSPLSAQTSLLQAKNNPNSQVSNDDEAEDEKYSIAILQQEASDLEALERVLLCLSQEEVKLAAKYRLIDVGVLVNKTSHIVSTNDISGVPNEEETLHDLQVECSVLPSDIVDAIEQARYCTEWLKDTAASVTCGLPEDDVAPVLAKGEYASFHERNRLTMKSAPSLYSTFTADEMQLLEAYEEQTANPVNALSSSPSQPSKGPTRAVLSGTNPVLRRLCTIDPQLQEAMLIMDRTRRDSLMDEEFQDALRYVNAQHSRSLQRYNTFVSMKGVSGEEKRELTRKGLLMSQTGAHKNLKRDNSSTFSNSDTDVSNSNSSFLDKYDERSLAIAKGVRVMNPGAPSVYTPGGSVDIPYFLTDSCGGYSGGGSIPPPHASINIPLPTRNKIGRRAERRRSLGGSKKNFPIFGR